MARNVGEAFLEDSEERGGGFSGKIQFGFRQPHFTRNAGALLKPPCLVLQRAAQSQLVQYSGTKIRGDFLDAGSYSVRQLRCADDRVEERVDRGRAFQLLEL